MMMSLFSVFDPVVLGVAVNWVIILWVFLFVPVVYYYWGSSGTTKLGGLVEGMFSTIAGVKYSGVAVLGGVMFIYLFLGNYLGLFFYVFTVSAHPIMTMGIGVVLWVSFFVMGWTCFFSGSAAHLVPEGSPLMLAPVLVIIESVSHLMRPFTLSIRLAANMMAGHLIVGLLSSISEMGAGAFVVSLMLQVVLLMLEWAVSMIQAMVFGILVVLYALEYS